jgi:CRP-like cAMP-binding protein
MVAYDIASGKQPNRRCDPDDVCDDDELEEEDQDYTEADDEDKNQEQEQGAFSNLSEAEELFESIKEIIASLFRLAVIIRHSTTRDRFAKALSVQAAFDRTYDILHVMHKFPKLDRDATRWLAQRLGNALTQRRQFLMYTREHRNRLEEEPANLWLPSMETPKPAASTTYHASQGAMTQSYKNFGSLFAPTTASTLRLPDVPIVVPDLRDDQSQTSYALSSGDEEDKDHLRLPSLLDVSKRQLEFECPLCWTMQSLRNESAWRKHAFSDLRPYVCTFGNCDVKLFTDRGDWFEHELKQHRAHWYCHLCNGCNFASIELFRDHVRRHHAEFSTEKQLEAFAEASRHTIDRFIASDCPFCDFWESTLRIKNSAIPVSDTILVTPAQFRRHLGLHMQDLALFALPRGYLGEDCSEAGSAVDSVKVDAGGNIEDTGGNNVSSVDSLVSQHVEDSQDEPTQRPRLVRLTDFVYMVIIARRIIRKRRRQVLLYELWSEITPVGGLIGPAAIIKRLKAYNIFKEFPDFLDKLTSLFKPEAYLAGDFVQVEHRMATCTKWLILGALTYVGPSGEFKTVRDSAAAGENLILGLEGTLFDLPNSVTYTACSDCLVVHIGKETMIDQISIFPKVKKYIVETMFTNSLEDKRERLRATTDLDREWWRHFLTHSPTLNHEKELGVSDTVSQVERFLESTLKPTAVVCLTRFIYGRSLTALDITVSQDDIPMARLLIEYKSKIYPITIRFALRNKNQELLKLLSTGRGFSVAEQEFLRESNPKDVALFHQLMNTSNIQVVSKDSKVGQEKVVTVDTTL